MREDGWRNARSSDPITSHEAAEDIVAAHRLIVHRFMLEHDRLEGWTYGEVWDLTTGIGNPVEVMRRMSDLHRDGLLAWALDSRGLVIKRAWPQTGRFQQARRLSGMFPVVSSAISALPPEHRKLAVDELEKIASWLGRNSEEGAARAIRRATSILRRGQQ